MITSYSEAIQHWKGKPYYSLNVRLLEKFGIKLRKVALNGGFTCPNRDGTLGTKGCIFCSEGGSGDFAADTLLPPQEDTAFIAYFQSFTNTYGSVHELERCYMNVLNHPNVAALSIGTRPDCLPDDIIGLLERLNRIKPIWIELGLQTMHEPTARFIRRGYPLDVFTDSLQKLQQAGIETIVHTILGLPGESVDDILETHRFLAQQPIQGIKLQLLHILKGTDLDELYKIHPFHVLSLEEYTDLIIRCIELLPPDMVIHRITGDGPKQLLTAPLWSGYKKQVLNRIHHEFKVRNTWQGRLYTP